MTSIFRFQRLLFIHRAGQLYYICDYLDFSTKALQSIQRFMIRRSFFKKTTAALLGLGLTGKAFANKKNGKRKMKLENCATVEGNTLSFYSEAIKESITIFHIADTHLFKDDARGIPFQEFSGRMAKAYNETTHFQTGEKTNPEETFVETLKLAKEARADLIALVGDLFSFPSESAVEWVLERLKETGIPYIYIAGNHDWHYEGMEGTLEELRDTWTQKRLLPLYQGKHPLMATTDVKGVRFIAIDNSTYQINEDQLAFFREQVASGLPLVLLVHIPMYAPGKRISFGCGNPNWGAANDTNFEIERRPKWPEAGHTQTTFDFHKEVFSATNLLGVFAGHTHGFSMELVKGIPQIVTDDNASGGYLDVQFLPLENKDRELISES